MISAYFDQADGPGIEKDVQKGMRLPKGRAKTYGHAKNQANDARRKSNWTLPWQIPSLVEVEIILPGRTGGGVRSFMPGTLMIIYK